MEESEIEEEERSGRVERYEVINSGLTVYKLVNYEPGGNEIRVEEISAEEAAEVGNGKTEDGTIIHLRTITTDEIIGDDEDSMKHVTLEQEDIPVHFHHHHHHGAEEAATLLSLHGDLDMVPGDEEETEQEIDTNEMKLLHRVEVDDGLGGNVQLLQSADGQMILQHAGTDQRQYIQIFAADGDGVEPVEISLDQLDPITRQSLYEAAASSLGGSIILQQTHQQDEPEIVVNIQQEQQIKEREPSTAAALDLGCEWSLTLPFGFQGQTLNDQCQKLILNVWHYFKHLKKYPELLTDKNAQGLAGDALNVGTKTIGRIGKLFRRGKVHNFLNNNSIKSKKQKVVKVFHMQTIKEMEDEVRKTLKGRLGKKGKPKADNSFGSDDEDDVMIVSDDAEEESPQAGSSSSRGRGRGRGRGSPAKGRGKSTAAGRGRGGKGGPKMVQTTLPVRVKNKGHSTSVHQFDSGSDS